MEKVYVVFQMGQFGGVILTAFKQENAAKLFVQKTKEDRPKDLFRIEVLLFQ